jgi:hypothetical protein
VEVGQEQKLGETRDSRPPAREQVLKLYVYVSWIGIGENRGEWIV